MQYILAANQRRTLRQTLAQKDFRIGIRLTRLTFYSKFGFRWVIVNSIEYMFVQSAPARSYLLPPCGGGKKQTRNMALVAASLGPAGMKPTEAKKSSMGAR